MPAKRRLCFNCLSRPARDGPQRQPKHEHRRSEALPDVPTVSEFIPGYEADAWNGVGAPANTPSDIIEKLNTEINVALAEPALQLRLAELGSKPLSMTASEFGKFVAVEIEKWAKVIKTVGIKAE
jgi:tripartite-type tricarboxylate transporter receptor subunit TctC